VIIDLTLVLDGTGSARLLGMVAGRSAAALKTWLATQSPQFRDHFEVVTMDGFGGYKTAAAEQLPEATTVMDPVPRRGASRREARRVPPTHAVADPGPPRPHRRPALRCAPHPAYPAAPLSTNRPALPRFSTTTTT
jgi:transposase